MEKFLLNTREFVRSEIDRTKVFQRIQADIPVEIGKKLAQKLGADIGVVEAGTLLMDSMIGKALQEGRYVDHINMALEKANDLFKDSSLSEEVKENIRHCILEHHGSEKFYSLESEICCNADCYKFVSIKGFSIALRYTRDMSLQDLIKLLSDKLDEKWNAVSLDIVKKELTPQHQVLLQMLEGLKEE